MTLAHTSVVAPPTFSNTKLIPRVELALCGFLKYVHTLQKCNIIKELRYLRDPMQIMYVLFFGGGKQANCNKSLTDWLIVRCRCASVCVCHFSWMQGRAGIIWLKS